MVMSLGRGERVLACSLAGTAGFVDAVGFLELGGYFVSFMSGNLTRLAVSGAEFDVAGIALVGGILTAFFAGAMLGAAVTRIAARRLVALPDEGLDPGGREFRRATGAGRERVVRTVALGCVALLLAVAAVVHTVAPGVVAMACIAAAMGAMNSVFTNAGEVRIGLTYMTGAVVKSAHRLVDVLAGGPWRPLVQNVSLWVSLLVGGVFGAWAQLTVGGPALWIPVAVVLAGLAGTEAVRRRVTLRT